MTIVVVEPPTPRTSGRRPRLSDEDIEQLAVQVSGGRWASDGQKTTTRSAAYQRAQSAVKLLGERFKLDEVKTSVYPVNNDAFQEASQKAQSETEDPKKFNELITKYYTDGFLWSVGPYPEGQTPRRKQNDGNEQQDGSQSE